MRNFGFTKSEFRACRSRPNIGASMIAAGNAWRSAMTESSIDRPPGFVYFIRAGRTANVKIGYATDPYKRVDGMQTGNPHPLYLIGYIPGDMNDEFEWHTRWRAMHVRGEWFQLKQGLRDAINAALLTPGACRYIHVQNDWRALNKARLQFHKAKRPSFISREESEGWHKMRHESDGSS